ncbi:hypothetical protein [Streptomyces venezuelae]|uniref:hypothetical protein n=1 Tax=Streptomyces venezuelae TaxID=54571 RepID=UPI00295EBA0A|nr:hypothetical protein [Streptomyces venezuelae]
MVTGYDTMGQPAGIKTVLAASDPLVVAGAPQTFTTSTAYNLDGTVQNTILPAVGGLPVETVAYKYNDLGMPTSVEGMTDYVRSIRPHTLTGDVLRLRQAAHVDVSVPLDRIASVRHELLFTHDKKAEGELNLAVGSQTSVTVELTEPVDAPRFFGAPRPVRLIRCHADDARALYRALDEAVTRVRTAPSPSPGPPPRA